jgi:hypothetical protein
MRRVANIPENTHTKGTGGMGFAPKQKNPPTSSSTSSSPHQHQMIVYFQIQTYSKDQWGLYEGLNNKLKQLGLHIMDHRTWHPPTTAADHNKHEVWVANELHCRDTLSLHSATTSLSTVIEQRKQIIANTIHACFSKPDAQVQVNQWYPDQHTTSTSSGAGGSTRTQRQKAKSTPIGRSSGTDLFQDTHTHSSKHPMATLWINDSGESFQVHVSPASLQALRNGHTTHVDVEPSVKDRLHGLVRNKYHY